MSKKKRLICDEMIKYTISNLNLRENKSTQADIITVIPEGSKVEVINAEEDWYEVIYEDQRGFAYSEYLSKTKYTWNETPLRPSPDPASNPQSMIPSKERIQVLGTDGLWSHIIYDDKEGYIYNDLLTDDGNPSNGYNFGNFYIDINEFVNDNNIKSPTNNLIITDLNNKLTYIFEKDEDEKWIQLYRWSCTVGKPTTPTIEGTFHICGRKPYFGTDEYRVKYATRIKGAYYYNSILFNADGTEVIDDTLGAALSHGSIRLEVDNAQWIYDNILDTTLVMIK